MKHYTGDRLYVNVGPSQAKRRLKGHGLGVKKVQSVGRNQSVVIHTATGHHLTELKNLFADVATSSTEAELGIPVEQLKNLGPTSTAWLHEINVHTRADLAQLGPVEAFRLIRRKQPSATFNLLWALAGALLDIDWRELPESEKQKLRSETKEQ
jgi:hypothetical protein